jgi:signal recognition particle receptor subunit alpha
VKLLFNLLSLSLSLFQVAYQRILQLTYVNDLLAALKSLFVKYYEPFLTTFVTSLHAINNAKTVASEVTSWDFSKAFEGWDTIFDKLLRGLEDKAAQVIFWALKC